MMRQTMIVLVLFLVLVSSGTAQKPLAQIWQEVEVIRTAHGVPHIRAGDLRAAGYALAWMQCEDYGTTTPFEILEASGRWASVEGYQRVESDFLITRTR